jgi:protein-L-isoaspartate(D-aspartate) O-methyltransferase
MVAEQLRRRDIVDPAVLAAFAKVPREAFVAPSQASFAYDDSPLPIGFSQTISQPYVVALIMQALAFTGSERVLEVGTGSGYAAAILGTLAREVDSIERIPELAAAAAELLARLGYVNVRVHCADGSLGWPPGAPYEAIAVSASAPRPPPPLLEQLAPGGRIVLPIGDERTQRLLRITREGDRFREEDLGDVRFVPLVGEEGWPVKRPWWRPV